jgi:hypothetical protein
LRLLTRLLLLLLLLWLHPVVAPLRQCLLERAGWLGKLLRGQRHMRLSLPLRLPRRPTPLHVGSR